MIKDHLIFEIIQEMINHAAVQVIWDDFEISKK